jgi:hypothetical protein
VTFVVDGLLFDIPDDWMASKCDAWAFYRRRFIKVREGIKSVDLIAIDPEHTVWLIEAKDYRRHRRTKAAALHEEVAHKVVDTLAALLPAAVNGDEAEEKAAAKRALAARRIRVVLHLEQPAKHSRLRPRAIDPADVLQKLRSSLRAIDPHPIVAEKNALRSLAWTVR